MEFCNARRTQFNLEGQFLGFVSQPGTKLKYLRILVEAGELIVKIPKEFRAGVYQRLVPGDLIQVFGEKKIQEHSGAFKLKAYWIHQVSSVVASTELATEPLPCQTPVAPCQQKTKLSKIRVCQGSGCRKRGGKRLLSCLETALKQLGLQHQVRIEQTGCVKQCSSAPNVVFPGKNRCGKIRPDAVAELIAKHFETEPNSCEIPFECN